MQIYSREQVTGNKLDMLTTDALHFNDKGITSQKKGDPVQSFSQVLFNAVDQSNDLQLESDNLEQKMILNPEEVDIHAVMIASEKARLSISFLKSITEKALRAYNDIMMLR